MISCNRRVTNVAERNSDVIEDSLNAAFAKIRVLSVMSARLLRSEAQRRDT